ncbi:hypothetical protein HHK36_029838 [Tetracentron sinense]|uniref:Uncharacterized protein n=1 Tax=Tetracentron sinense TaxID=13715 RepID=A0A834YEM2_TETSI|nr:hypothetical protein HHK36_029838 [Tetracentron sinense]
MIEIGDIVHEFVVADKAHSKSDEIYLVLDELSKRLKMAGYVPMLDVDQETPNNTTFSFSKEHIISSLTEVEKTIIQVQEVGSAVLDYLQHVLQVVIDLLKPTADVALPILQMAGDQALKITSPAISEASKKPFRAQELTVADVAQETTKVIEDAKLIASWTIETISSADPIVIVETAGALILAYLLLLPIWSVISFSVRGYKGELTPAQSLDLIHAQNHLLIDIRPERNKNKPGIPLLPSALKKR